MRKFLVATLGAISLWSGANVQADAVADQKIFNAAMAQVEPGGISLSYSNFSLLYRDVITGLDLIDQCIPAKGAPSSDFKPYLALARQVIGDLELSAFQAVASSVKEQSNGLYRYRTFVYTGNSRLSGPLFNMTTFKNTSWKWLRTLPAATRFAAEITITPDRAWLETEKLLQKLNRPEIAPLLKQLKQEVKTTTGVEWEQLLRAISGRWQIALISANNAAMPIPQIYLSLPDQNGKLWKLIQQKSGLAFQKKSSTAYTVQLPISAQPATVELGHRRITVYSDPMLKARFDGSLLKNPATAPYFKNLPAKGMAFSYLNVDVGLWAMGGAFVPAELQGIMRKLPAPVLFSYGEHKSDGLASTTLSNWRLTTSSVAIAAQLGGVLFPMLDDLWDKSKQDE